MKRLMAVLTCSGLVLAMPALGQEKKAEKPKDAQKMAEPAKGDKKGEPSMEEQMKAYMESGAPGAYHKWLAKSAGHWKTSMKMLDPASGQWSEATEGQMKSEMILDGRFLAFEFKSTFMGGPFTGKGVNGYNNLEKRFESVWIDTMTTGIMMQTGQVDKDGKVLTLTGEHLDPTGRRKTMKQTSTWVDDNTMRDEFYDVADGKETKTMEITYTRAAANAKSDEAHAKHEGKGEAKKSAK